MNQVFKTQYEVGIKKEVDLMSILSKDLDSCTKIVVATQDENIREHTDFKLITTHNIDVKSLKKISRSDAEVQEDYHYLEIKNVRGEHSSLYNDFTTHLAFELFDCYILVEKEKLQDLVKRKVKKEFVTQAKDSLYKLYQREGRKDIITLVKSLDLVKICCKIVYKKPI